MTTENAKKFVENLSIEDKKILFEVLKASMDNKVLPSLAKEGFDEKNQKKGMTTIEAQEAYTIIGYGNAILDPENNEKLVVFGVTSDHTIDTVYVILHDKSSNTYKISIAPGSEKRIIKNPDFVRGCRLSNKTSGISPLGASEVRVDVGDLRKDGDTYYVVDKPTVYYY